MCCLTDVIKLFKSLGVCYYTMECYLTTNTTFYYLYSVQITPRGICKFLIKGIFLISYALMSNSLSRDTYLRFWMVMDTYGWVRAVLLPNVPRCRQQYSCRVQMLVNLLVKTHEYWLAIEDKGCLGYLNTSSYILRIK